MSGLPLRPVIERALPLLAVAVGVVAFGCDVLTPVMDSPPASPPAVTSPGPAPGGDAAGGAVDIDIPLEALLERKSPALVAERNLFRFGSAAGRGREASGASPSAGGRSPSVAPGRGSAEPAGVTGTMVAPPAPDRLGALRLIGVVEARDRPGRVAVLADGDDVYHGLVNDVVRGRYRILSITATSIEVEDLVRGTRTLLRLSGGLNPVPE